MERTEKILWGSLIAIALFICLFVSDLLFARYAYVTTGAVVEKTYSPGKAIVGVAPVVGGKGGVAIVTSSTSDKYVLTVEFDGTTDLLKCDKETYIRAGVGSRVGVYKVTGWISGIKFGLVARQQPVTSIKR